MKYAGVGQPSLLSLPRGAVVNQRLCQRVRQKVELEHAPLQPVPFEAYAEGVHGDVPKRALPLTPPTARIFLTIIGQCSWFQRRI